MTTLAKRTFWISLAIILLLSRAAHVNVLWADEDYHLAVGLQTFLGKMLYRDVWYDKPPLNALLLVLIGGWPGWPLRLASVAMELAGAAVAYRFASRLWGQREGYIAAGAFVFFHVFYFAATAIPVEPDTLMILPHLLAVYWAWSKRPVLAGFAAGLAFLLSTKGLFVLAACFLFYPSGWLLLSAGFLAPCAVMGGWLVSQNAFAAYVDQVWRWGMLYAANPPPEPWSTPLVRLGNWLAFHSALVLGCGFAWRRIEDRALRWKLAGWIGIALIAATIGWRLPPHYLNQVFPALVTLGSRGIATLLVRRSWWQVILLAAVVIPIGRFGPRYVELLAEDLRGEAHGWRDVTMDRESRDGAALVQRIARPGDTIFVWGYRPNVVAYTRLPVSGQMWESQPITLVPADRHLKLYEPLDADWAERNQTELLRTRPAIIVDGLSAYNPQLDIHNFSRLAEWMKRYCKAGTAGRGMTVYRLCE
jgi:hypothetical protein